MKNLFSFLLVLFALNILQLNAATITSVKDGNWKDPSVWDLKRVPTSADDVVIDHSDNITISAGDSVSCRDLHCDNGSRFYIYGIINLRDFWGDNNGHRTWVYGKLYGCTMYLDNGCRVYGCSNIYLSNCTNKTKPLEIQNGARLIPIGGQNCTAINIGFTTNGKNIDLSVLCNNNIGIQTLDVTNANVTLATCNNIVDYIKLNTGGDCIGSAPTWTGQSKLAINRNYTFNSSSILWQAGTANTPKTIDILSGTVNVTTAKTVVTRMQLLGGTVTGGTNLIFANNSYLFRCGGILAAPAQMGTNVTVEMCSDTNTNNPPAIIGTTDMPPGGFTGDLIISTNVKLGGNVSVPTGKKVVVTSTGTLNDSNFFVNSATAVTVQSGGTIVTSKSGGLTGPNSLLGTLPTTLDANSTTIYNATSGTQTVSNNVTYGNLVVSGSSTKTISGTTNVQGDFTIQSGSGAVTAATNSTMVFNGNEPQNISGIAFYNVVLDSSGTKTLTSPATTQGLITINQNATLNTNNQLTVLSNATGTSGIGPLVNGADIVGNICWERFIPGGSSRRRWRFLSMPIWQQTFKNAWQDEIFITGPGTGGVTCPNLTTNSNGFDQNHTGLSRPLDTAFYSTIFTWDERFNRWRVLPSANNTIDPLTAYRTYVRGDRKIEGCSLLVQMPDSVSSVTIRSCGPPVKFDQSKTVTFTPTSSGGGNGWNYITNPYPCSIDWNNPQFASSRSSAIDPTIYIYNPSTNNYATWNPLVGGTNGGSNIVGTAQSLFIRTTQTTTINWKESYKTFVPTSGLFGKSSNPNQLNIKLVNPEFSDEAVFFFYKSATKAFDERLDGIKVGFGLNTIATGMSGVDEKMVYNAIPATNAIDTVLLYTGLSTSSTNYSITFLGVSSFGSQYMLLLRDKFNNTLVNLATNDKYNFSTIAGTPNSFSQTRFELIVINGNSLPVSLIDFTAKRATKENVSVQWLTASEVNNSHFVVERSNDGIQFSEIATVKGNGTTANTSSYSIVDEHASSGINYYRLKQVDFDGSINYSYVVVLNPESENNLPTHVTLYPQPVSDVLNVIINDKTNIYVKSMRVMDIAGKMIMEKDVQSNTLDVSVLAKGTYIVSVTLTDGTVENSKFIKQ